MKRIFTALLALILLFAAGCQQTQPQEPGVSLDPLAPVQTEKMDLYVLNWGDYIEDEVLADFRTQYPNISLNYTTVASNEEMLVMLESGAGMYDLCFPSEYTIERLLKLDLLQPIDKSKVPNLENIDEAFMDQAYDPGNKYSIPYMWGTVGILYNKTMVQEDVDSWGILWDERYKKQILMYDSIRDSIGITLKKLGKSMNTRSEADILEAQNELIAQKPLVLAYGTDDLRDKMKGESAALAVMYSGDAIESIAENENLAFAVPMEGSNIWFDSMVIPKASKNIEAAHIFIDFLCRADIAARNTEYLGYSTPNKAALALVSEELRNDPTYNPPKDVIDRCEVFGDLGDFIGVYNDAWLKIKATPVQ